MIEYNPFKTLEDLAKVGIDINNIVQVKTPYFEYNSTTKEYNPDDYDIKHPIITRMLTDKEIERINAWPNKVFWYPGNSLNPKEYDNPEFQKAQIYGAIRIRELY